jgi:hypothetical protein
MDNGFREYEMFPEVGDADLFAYNMPHDGSELDDEPFYSTVPPVRGKDICNGCVYFDDGVCDAEDMCNEYECDRCAYHERGFCACPLHTFPVADNGKGGSPLTCWYLNLYGSDAGGASYYRIVPHVPADPMDGMVTMGTAFGFTNRYPLYLADDIRTALNVIATEGSELIKEVR